MSYFVVTKARALAPKPKTRVRSASRAKRLDALTRRMANSVGLDLYKGLTTFKRKISLDKLREAWRTGRWHDIDRFIPWDELPPELDTAQNRLSGALTGSTSIAIAQLPPQAKELRWDVANPAIRNYIAHKTGNLITRIKNEQRELVRTMVTRHFTEALTPYEAAKQIVDSIGLHPRYQKAVQNYRKTLFQQGRSLDQVDRMSERYSDRLRKARAMTIARTETRQAANHGQRVVWREAANQGFIDRQKSKRTWVIDGNPCEECEPMDGVQTTIDEPYPGGYEPGEVHPNCECIEVLDTQ